jgi:parvulin-like peptidyl-prolyl isomerase
MNAWAKTICRLLVALMIWTPYQFATAGMIGTDQAVTSTSSQADRTAVLNFLSRSDVANQLHLLGIDASNAKDRVAAMTDQEVQQLAGRINALPAGADTSWGAVLLVILIVAAVWWFWQR